MKQKLKLFIFIVPVLVTGIYIYTKINFEYFNNPTINFKKYQFHIPKEWKLNLYIDNNKNIYYKGYLNISPYYLYFLSIFDENTTLKSVDELMQAFEYTSKTFLGYDKMYNFDDNTSISIAFRLNSNELKEMKKLYNDLKKEKDNIFITENKSISHFQNYPVDTLVYIDEKDNNETKTLYRILLDNVIMDIHYSGKISDKSKLGLGKLFKEIEQKHKHDEHIRGQAIMIM